MLSFPRRRPKLGLEIRPDSIRLAVVTGAGSETSVLFAKTAKLPEGMVSDEFSSQNIIAPEGFSSVLKDCVSSQASHKTNRAALSLPDGVFRVQTLEFDELPARRADIERLIRWRLDKSAAFDTSGIVIKHQTFKRQEKGFSVLACAAKQEVITQYEALLLGLGLEPWVVGLSSFNTLNFYYDYLSGKCPVFAFAHITGGSFTTIIMENGGVRFYRFKEIKKGEPEEINERVMRDIEDSLHFYIHMDRAQPSEVKHLCLAGDFPYLDGIARGFKDMTTLEVNVLSPDLALGTDAGPAAMAAAIGAGGLL